MTGLEKPNKVSLVDKALSIREVVHELEKDTTPCPTTCRRGTKQGHGASVALARL